MKECAEPEPKTMQSHPIMLLLTLWASPFLAQSQTIGKVRVLETGINANPDEKFLSQACSRFRPTPAQVQRFFRQARPVPRRFGLHDRYAPCYATGTIEISRFGAVPWRLSSGGVGSLKWDEGEYVYLFRRKNPWTDPTACTYGLGDEGEC